MLKPTLSNSMFMTAALLAASAGPAVAAVSTDIVAVTGQTEPGGNGQFSGFQNTLAINDAGQVAFWANLTGTSGGTSDNAGIFRGDGTLPGQASIARAGDADPGSNGQFSSFLPIFDINNAGQVAFWATLNGTSGGTSDNAGIFRGSGTLASQARIARAGDTEPGSNGQFSNFGTPVINDAGQVAFYATLTGTSGGTSDNAGIFRGSGTLASQARIARAGDTEPGSNGQLSSIGLPVINDAGQVAFYATLTGTSGGGSDNTGIFRGSGTLASQARIARRGETEPGGNGQFENFSPYTAINDGGQVSFYANLTGTSGGASDDSGIFRGSGTLASQVRIAREGETEPGGNGQFNDFDVPVINDAGQVAFWASLTGTSGGASDDSGIFRGSGTLASQIAIAREGDTAPGGNGQFSFLQQNNVALNDAGQVAFFANLAGTSGGASDDAGIYFYDDGLGLIEVAREGDALLGSSIISLILNKDGLNNTEQVAYNFTLADGRSGVALATVPEPSSLAVIGLAGLLLTRRRR